MKDYTIKKKDKKNFILKYEITDDNQIVIYYASGRKYVTDYTKELEKDILEQMKNQVLNTSKSSKFMDMQSWNWFLRFVLLFVADILAVNHFDPLSLFEFLGITISITTGYALLYMPIRKKIQDYKKNLLYVKNMDLFQEGIREDMGMYLGLNRKSNQTIHTLINKKKEQENISEDDKILREPTLNTVDQISARAMADLYDLLTRNEEFSKYYDNSSVKVKSRTLKK